VLPIWGQNEIKRKTITNECGPLCEKKNQKLREKPSQMNVAHYVKKKRKFKKKNHHK
jgi:hypothetical protein